METLKYTFQAEKRVKHKAHVGVVGSANLEVIFLPTNNSFSTMDISSKFEGHSAVWKSILERFFAENNCLADIEINDFGATSGVISLRLLQALEVANLDNE
ncbi:MAG TPA: malonate decarboxylase acyl carrier protein [Ruminiclostridium sp.]